MEGAKTPRFELRHLRYVIAMAEFGGIRRAARALDVQPSTVSRRIRDLEDEIGAALFIRARSGASLTFAGERFLERAREAVNQISHAAQDAGVVGRGQEGVVRIGLISSLASGFLPELLKAYNANHADVRLEYIEGGQADHIPAVQQYRLDVAFLTSTTSAEGCDLAHLWNERVYVVMSAKHDLAEKEEIVWSDLSGQQFIVSEAPPGPEVHDYLVKHLSALGHSAAVERQAVYRDTLMQIVASGKEMTLTSEAMIAARFPGVVYRRLAGEILPFCAIWSPKNDNPAFRRLLSLAKVLSNRCEACLATADQARSAEPLQSPDPLQ